MNRVAFVTGAVRNTDWAIARGFAREGHDVILSSRTGAEAAAAAAKRAADSLTSASRMRSSTAR